MNAGPSSEPDARLLAELGAIGAQVVELRASYPEARAERLATGSVLVTIPNVVLGNGWNAPTTTVWFVAPVGYPVAKPDCFFVEPNVRLANGQLPANSQLQPIPDTNPEARLWFSWHVQQWNPATDRLMTFARVIHDRLRRVQ